jgi:branched-chain amino acid transport system substrate-binding protein
MRRFALVVALLLAACGQKVGVSDQAAGPGLFPASESGGAGAGAAPASGGAAGAFGTGTPDPAGSVEAGTGDPALAAGASRSGAEASPGAPAGPARSGRPEAPASGPRPGPATAAAPQPAGRGPAAGLAPAAAGPPAEDRTGVSDTEIVIGIHAPLTGAAPVPQDSLDKAKGLYWRFLAERGGVFGRNVRVVFRDDQYNPSRAAQVCREMVEKERVFLLMGLGADQVLPCARYAGQAGVPYFATGGQEEGLTELPTFFNVSMSFPQQAPMVAQLVKQSGKTKVGIVVMNTPNYNDTFRAFNVAAREAGLQVVRASRISKQATQSETLAEANALRMAGAESVMVLAAPLVFLNLAHSAQGQAYNPLWVGPGVSNGLNLVAEFGCPSIGAARFLSPFPQLDVIDRLDPDYRQVYRRYNGEEADDLGLAVWGVDKTLHRFFEAAGPDLTRQRFLATLQSGREFAGGIFPPVRYGPGIRFGARHAHVLEADCSARRYRTLATFASGL